MKKAIIFGSALSVVTLMLVSCASEPSATTKATTTTTSETMGSTPVHSPGGVGRAGQGTTAPGY